LPEFGNVRPPPSNSSQIGWNLDKTVEFWHKFSDFGQTSRNQVTNKLQCLAVVDSHKRACKNEEFKFIKRFTVLKTVNCFSKIKEAFTVKLKMISVEH
jgi:hypothetical protein